MKNSDSFLHFLSYFDICEDKKNEIIATTGHFLHEHERFFFILSFINFTVRNAAFCDAIEEHGLQENVLNIDIY